MGLFPRKHKDWPTAIANIDEITFDGVQLDFSGAFTVDAEFYSVQVHRESGFLTNLEELVAKIERDPHVVVRYNPNDPTENEVEID